MKQKQPYKKGVTTALDIVQKLKPYCDRIEIAGSLRRKREFVGDIEIVALPKRSLNLLGEPDYKNKTQLDIFLESKISKFRLDGAKMKSWQHGGFQVDLFLPETPDHWGSIFMIRTGSSGFNKWVMTTRAKACQIKFKSGLVYTWNYEPLPTPEEKDVFKLLKMDFVPPESRDDHDWLKFRLDN
jgi:DNA polymerase/3'-5' exonuclease PolX